MPLSKERDRERKRLAKVRLESSEVRLEKPDKPNRYLLAHIKAYPEGFNSDGSYRKDYDPALDPYINPLVRLEFQGVIPKPLKQDSVKLPWYAGARDHFGVVVSPYYADLFFSRMK